MKNIWSRVALFCAAILAIVLVFRLTPLKDLVSFRTIIEQKDALVSFVRSHAVASGAIFVAIYFLVTAVSIPGALVLTISGGVFFGPVLAPIYSVVGATAGAAVVFLVTRYILGASLQEKYADRLTKMNAELDRNGTNYMLTVRLIPAIPFFLINILAGLTRLPLRTFVWTSLLGMFPGSFVYAYLGHAAGSLESLRLSPQIIVALALLGLFSLVPVIYRKLRARRGADAPSGEGVIK